MENDMKRELKNVGGHVMETKVSDRNGVQVGVIEGYIATFEADTGGMFGVPDRFEEGAFLASLQEHRDRGNRPIRLKDHHGRTVGSWPIETAHEDAVGLFAVGEINLETQQGREAFSLIRQGALSDLSIGFSSRADSVEEGIRVITEAVIWEGSVVDEPANRSAQITSVKSALPFLDLPLAAADHEWIPAEASARVGALDQVELKSAFAAESADGPEIPIADVVEGELVAVPAAVMAAAQELKDADEKDPELIRHLERYLAKMNQASPFDQEDRQFYGIDECRSLSARDIENTLAKCGAFSKGAARVLAGRVKDAAPEVIRDAASEEACYPVPELKAILRDLEDSLEDVKG